MYEYITMRSATQEVFTQRNIHIEVCDSVGREVVKLSTEEVQKTSKERMRGKGESTVDMGGKEDALTRLRLRLCLALRQPQSPGDDQTRGGQIL